MGRLRKIWNAIRARYEAAYQQWGQRSYIFGTVQDAKFDANASTRLELVRRHRQWTVNNGLVFRLRCLFQQFSVGVDGLWVVPNSNDEDWNVSRAEGWNEWCQNPELGSNMTMGELHTVWAGCMFDDGEVFVIKTSGLSPTGQIVPMIQTVEAHRCETPKELLADEGKRIWDGIEYDNFGRPKGYHIRRLNNQDVYDWYDADDVVHIFKARRPGMGRGLPEGYSVMNDLHDLDDLQLLEMQAAKAAARITNVVTNASGTANPKTMRRTMLNIQSQNQNGQATTKEANEYYNVTLGGDTVVLRRGDDIKQFQNMRPSVVTQEYWDCLASKICCGYNQPKLLVLPYSMQGTVTRADLEVCKGAYRANFVIIKNAVEKIYRWQTGWAIKFDRSLINKKGVEGMLECVIRPPRAPDVDVGRNAQSQALDLKVGLSQYQDIFAERGQDWRVQLRQSAEAAKFIQQLATEFDVPGIEIANKLQVTITEKIQDDVDPADEATGELTSEKDAP